MDFFFKDLIIVFQYFNFHVAISEHLLVHRIFNDCAPQFGTGNDVDNVDISEVL